MRSCRTADDQLFAFADGLEETLDDHVAECDECQTFLAELWIGELRRDLSDPVLRQIKLEKFLAEVLRFGLDVASGMAEGAVEYTIGRDH